MTCWPATVLSSAGGGGLCVCACVILCVSVSLCPGVFACVSVLVDFQDSGPFPGHTSSLCVLPSALSIEFDHAATKTRRPDE